MEGSLDAGVDLGCPGKRRGPRAPGVGLVGMSVCELQLPSPCEGGRLSQHDVDERRITKKANSELEFAVLWLQGAESAVVAQR